MTIRYFRQATALAALALVPWLLATAALAASDEATSTAPAEKSAPQAPADIKANFKKADLDKDGSLSAAEAKGTGFFRGESFDETDQDENGYVTLFELAQALTQSTQRWMEEHDEHDENDDGHVDRVVENMAEKNAAGDKAKGKPPRASQF